MRSLDLKERKSRLNGDMEKTVREFVIRNFIFDDDGSLQSETSFLDNGIIDSTGVLELIDFIEKSYAIKVEDQEIIPENLDSVHNIVSYLECKLGAARNLQHAEASCYIPFQGCRRQRSTLRRSSLSR